MISSGEKITFYFYTANPGFNSKQNKKNPLENMKVFTYIPYIQTTTADSRTT